MGQLAAQTAGYYAKIAEEVFYMDSPDQRHPNYADNLDELLKIDINLTTDPQVTFIFGECNSRGYTFTTRHKDSTAQFVYRD